MNAITCLRPILLWIAFPFASLAQDPAPENPFADAIQDEDPGTAPAAEEPGENLAEKLMALSFDRSPQAIFTALKSVGDPAAPDPVKAFARAVMFGDWETVAKTLASLPQEKARPVYTKLVATIASQAVGVGTLLRDPNASSGNESPHVARRRLEQESERLSKLPAPVLSEDFFGLVEAAPGNVTAEQISALAKIAGVALGVDGRPSLVARLRDGWKGLGGESPDGALLATRLLSELNWIRDAAPFLPLEENEWPEADRDLLVFTMEYFTTTGIEDRDERQLARAAAVCAQVMKSSRIGNYTRPQFRLAMQRLVTLLPVLEPDAAQSLIREQLFSQQASLFDLISIFGEQGRDAIGGDDLQARIASLGTQRLILDALAPIDGPLPSNVALLVLNWLAEAEACYRAGGVVPAELSQADLMMMRRYGMSDQLNVKTLSTEQTLDTVPPEGIITRLNAGLTQRVRLTVLKLNVLAADSLDLAEVRAYAERHPGLERQICHDIIAAWVAKQSKPAESERVKQMRAQGMYVPPQMTGTGQGIPLTRLRQNQNIEDLGILLAELRDISPEPLDPALIVEAFMAIHSGAEVYQLDDIIAIFGPPESMVRSELLNLIEGMRARLGEEWRNPETQQRASTNRTEEETKNEVSRGYRTALELAKRGIPDDDRDWRALITRGRLFFDASQYEFERGIQLTEYVSLRDEAFAGFRQAAETYAAGIPTMPVRQWTIEPYQAWFFVMLGASDLAQLTSNAARTDPGLQAIGDAMRALPGEAADRHLAMFGEMLGTIFPRVPANVRQRFLSSGLGIIGEDHPAATAATRPLDYYRELLDEIQLRITVDGPTEVGHGQPFGLFIGLEATRQLLRESGGFGKYLRGPGSQGSRSGGGGGDLRGNFERNIHAALGETFEISTITFHDPAVKPIPLPREGWVETPLAYIVLRAKNAAVDRIPSIQLDMDFVDQPGQVVLPVMSQVLPIDARADATPPRPCPDLAFEVTMDERDWPAGTLAVEITASGKGIIANIGDYFDYERPGFDVEVVDRTLLITEFISDGSSRTPSADRNWQLTYTRQAGLDATARFPLPQPIGPAEMARIDYKLYSDTDLINLTPEEAAAGVALDTLDRSAIAPWLYGGLGVLALAILLWLALRTRKSSVAPAQTLTAPADPTPFSTVVFLRRIRSERADQLNPQDRDALTAQIHEIETTCFRPDTTVDPDLRKIVNKWFGIAMRAG